MCKTTLTAHSSGAAVASNVPVEHFEDLPDVMPVLEGMAERPVGLGFAYSTPMAQYFDGAGIPWVLDMVDVDSEKFAAYGAEGRWPMRHVWAREARTLLAYEAQSVRQAQLSLLVSEEECQRL